MVDRGAEWVEVVERSTERGKAEENGKEKGMKRMLSREVKDSRATCSTNSFTLAFLTPPECTFLGSFFPLLHSSPFVIEQNVARA